MEHFSLRYQMSLDERLQESRIVIVGDGHLASRIAGTFTGAGYRSVSVAGSDEYIPSNENADLVIVCAGAEGSERPPLQRVGANSLEVPVVFVSGQSGAAARIRALAAGASACLTQPLDPFELLFEVRRTLENRLRAIAWQSERRLARA